MTAWVAVQADWTGYSGWVWAADLGPYTGPSSIAVPAGLPADAAEVDFYVGALDGGGLASGAFVGPYGFCYRYVSGGSELAGPSGGTSIIDRTSSPVVRSTARLYVVWDPTGPSVEASADLVAPSVSPDSFVPAGYVGGAVVEARPVVSLYDTDGSFVALLPLAAGIQWQEELQQPGSLTVRLPLDDSATALVTPRRIVKVYWRGAFRLAARVDGSSTDVAVEGRVWREWSLPGLLSILGRMLVYPEYGLDRTSNGTRTFGYPSRYGHGAWLGSGDFTAAVGVDWSAMTGRLAGYPAGLDYPNPQWIARTSPTHIEPAGSVHYFRHLFPTSVARSVQILATADNYLDLWLDGEQIVSSDGQGLLTWRDAFQVTMTLQPSPTGGRHTIAARVRNRKHTDSTLAFIFTMQEIDDTGAVIVEAPIVNSDSDWIVSDVAPGFRRAEVLIREWSEASDNGYAAASLIGLDFSGTNDSSGAGWADAPAEYTFDVGSSVLDMLAAFTEKDVDALIDPRTLKLQMWNRKGADLSGSVQLALGSADGNLISHQVQRVEPTFNTVLTQLRDGRWTQRQDAASVTAGGREGSGLSMGSTSDTGSAAHVADAQLLDASRATITFTSEVSSLDGPQVYVDYGLGDTISVPNEDGAGLYAARVMAVTVDVPDDGSPVKVTPELMLDRSATPPTLDADGPGSGDPGGDV